LSALLWTQIFITVFATARPWFPSGRKHETCL